MTAYITAAVAALRGALPKQGPTGVSQLRKVVSECPVAVLVADDRSRFLVVNSAACKLTGYTEAELRSMSMPDLTAPVDAGVADQLWQAFLGQGEQRGEFAIRRRDGTTLMVHYVAHANLAPGFHASFLTPAGR